MRQIRDMHPFSVTVFFVCVTMLAMSVSHPAVTAASLVLSMLLFTVLKGAKSIRTHILILIFFIIFTLINPVISHKGSTVLFMVNDTPVTLESLLYGLNAAAGLCSVFYWVFSFSAVMDSERMLCVFGFISPRAALVASCSIRYLTLIKEQYRRTKLSMRAIGLYTDGNIVDLIRGNMRVFSSVIGWALENGIATADSMAARGCGSTKRTAFSVKKFRLGDGVFMAAALMLSALCVTCSALGSLKITFYPETVISPADAAGFIGIASFILLAVIPSAIETGVKLKWRRSMSEV